ncbi:hypothetical protein JMJ55_25215 [Belnapia sp. T6]|uniref:Uncharacterized protein n=1 Tax=Belnapia mucosa TaxID=2804532 RepID=A0ABS1VAG4_9PROT|nr:hypothetical protein [Belnapia mucosa]MBL6458643.1 hypothetical protein [Belnapia mucosa]
MAEIAELALRQAGRHGPASAERIELLSLAAGAGLGSNGDAKALAAGQSAAELGEQACGGGAGGANGQPAPADLADGCAKLRLMRPILAHGQWVAKLAPLVRSWQQTKVIPRDPASRSTAAEAARRYFPEVATPAIAAYRTASVGPALSPQASDFARDWLQQMRCATMVIQALNIGEPGLRDEVGGMVRQFPAELRQPGCGPAA